VSGDRIAILVPVGAAARRHERLSTCGTSVTGLRLKEQPGDRGCC
jgi:hypothetical protein